METIQSMINNKNKEIEEINKKLLENYSNNEKIPLLEKKNYLLEEINNLLTIQKELNSIKDNELKHNLLYEKKAKKRKKDINEEEENEDYDLIDDNYRYPKGINGESKKKLAKSFDMNNINIILHTI